MWGSCFFLLKIQLNQIGSVSCYLANLQLKALAQDEGSQVPAKANRATRCTTKPCKSYQTQLPIANQTDCAAGAFQITTSSLIFRQKSLNYLLVGSVPFRHSLSQG